MSDIEEEGKMIDEEMRKFKSAVPQGGGLLSEKHLTYVKYAGMGTIGFIVLWKVIEVLMNTGIAI